MRKTFFWAVTALALLPGVVQRVNAQATGAADVAADASAAADGQSVSEAATGSADAATDSVSEAATGQTEAPPTPATPSPQPSADAAAAASAEAGTNTEGASPAGAEQPQADAAANADINANADGAKAQGQASFGAQANPANISAGLQFGSATDRGIALNRVANDSFLYRSGLRQGDVLISYGGQPIRSQADFSRWAVYQPGQRVPLVVWRDGREETVFVTYDQQPARRQAGYSPQSGGAYLGVTFDPQANRGAVVRSVAPGSPAENAGIAPGQIIVAINDRRVSNYQDVINYVATLKPGQEVDLIVAHRVTLSARQGQANYSAPPSGVAVESSSIGQAPVAPAPVGVVPATRLEERPAVARPGDADRDGRILDGDGRVGPRDRAGRR
jgi:membrane-associated protease RseP (regulator of RpoE activity)